MPDAWEKRLTQELEQLQRAPPPHICLRERPESLKEWVMALSFPEGCPYAGETHFLHFRFNENYPIEPPEVRFLPPVPLHEHIYTTGHVCIDQRWSPTFTAQTVCQRIHSKLVESSPDAKCRPWSSEHPPHHEAYMSSFQRDLEALKVRHMAALKITQEERLSQQDTRKILRQVRSDEERAKYSVELGNRPSTVQATREVLEKPVHYSPGKKGPAFALVALALSVLQAGGRAVVSGLSEAAQEWALGMAEHGCCSSYSTHMMAQQQGRKPVSYDFEVRLNDDFDRYPYGSSERESMLEKFKREAGEALGYPPDRIVITHVQRGSVRVRFTVRELHSTELQKMDCDRVKAAFKQQWQENFLSCNIHPIFMVCCVSPEDLDAKYDYDWTHKADTQKRGGRDYHQPRGYTGHAIRVLGKYDQGNNDWLMMDGRPREWAVAFHATKREGLTGVAESEWALRPGSGQAYEDKCGKGIYCTPCMPKAEGYTGVTVETTQGAVKVNVAFQCRVKPSAIKVASVTRAYWVINSPTDIRPYRVCLKIV
eukprot:TRINITY_DN21_c0_g2_i1.p1 TRINITY_DN21_c0_g2~~TRINITY_DN21_c0_g2_i1.p1  ORF type:complete len:566 (+),score=126.37 TRINITY_DN21_c0_g2_i1:82-1698(+)